MEELSFVSLRPVFHEPNASHGTPEGSMNKFGSIALYVLLLVVYVTTPSSRQDGFVKLVVDTSPIADTFDPKVDME
ncbi:hypothetical protein D3C78_1938860 [compost metagenome]